MKTKAMRIVKNNNGISLIELLVVIAIMGILVGGAAVGVNIIASGNVRKASAMVNSRLDELRTTTLSKAGSWWAQIVNRDGVYSIEICNDHDGEVTVKTSDKLGSRMNIALDEDATDGGEAAIEDGQRLVIAYAADSGKFSTVKLLNNDNIDYDEDSGDVVLNARPADASGAGRIITSGNNDNEYILSIWYGTGKISAE